MSSDNRQRTRLKNDVFYKLAQLSLYLAGKEHEGICVAVGDSDRIRKKAGNTTRGADLYKRLNIPIPEDGELPKMRVDNGFSGFVSGIVMETDDELDGSLIIGDDGLILPGLYGLNVNFARMESMPGRLPAGAGTNAAKSVSLTVPGAYGIRLSSKGTIVMYRSGYIDMKFAGGRLEYRDRGRLVKDVSVRTRDGRYYEDDGKTVKGTYRSRMPLRYPTD